jgi:hypothetical protein
MLNHRAQRGLRLTDATWSGLRIAALQNNVSAANLVESLGAEWLNAYQMGDPWAIGVLEQARSLQTDVNAARNGKRASKTAQIVEIGQ